MKTFIKMSQKLGNYKGYEHKIELINNDQMKSQPFTVQYKLLTQL